MNCRNCLYLLDLGVNPHDVRVRIYQCRRFPPTQFPPTMFVGEQGGERFAKAGFSAAIYPMIDPETAACGEFKTHAAKVAN